TEGGGVLGDPAEGAAQRQQPDPAVRARGGIQQRPDLVHRRLGQGLKQQALPVVAPAPTVVVVALGLEVEGGAGGGGVGRGAEGGPGGAGRRPGGRGGGL